MREKAYQQLAELISMAGGIDGRKKLQKIVFILKNKGAPFQEKFSYHYFGPYSAELQLEIDDMVTRGVIQEIQSGPGYKYSAGANVPDFDDSTLQSYSDLVARLNALPPTILELLATFYYLQAKGYSQSDMLTKTFQLKPHLKAQSQETQKYWADLTGN